MKLEAVTKRFTRKPRNAPQPEAMDFDTMRDTQSTSDSNKVISCSQKAAHVTMSTVVY
jgi:hypothetical protein